MNRKNQLNEVSPYLGKILETLVEVSTMLIILVIIIGIPVMLGMMVIQRVAQLDTNNYQARFLVN